MDLFADSLTIPDSQPLNFQNREELENLEEDKEKVADSLVIPDSQPLDFQKRKELEDTEEGKEKNRDREEREEKEEENRSREERKEKEEEEDKEKQEESKDAEKIELGEECSQDILLSSPEHCEKRIKIQQDWDVNSPIPPLESGKDTGTQELLLLNYLNEIEQTVPTLEDVKILNPLLLPPLYSPHIEFIPSSQGMSQKKISLLPKTKINESQREKLTSQSQMLATKDKEFPKKCSLPLPKTETMHQKLFRSIPKLNSIPKPSLQQQTSTYSLSQKIAQIKSSLPFLSQKKLSKPSFTFAPTPRMKNRREVCKEIYSCRKFITEHYDEFFSDAWNLQESDTKQQENCVKQEIKSQNKLKLDCKTNKKRIWCNNNETSPSSFSPNENEKKYNMEESNRRNKNKKGRMLTSEMPEAADVYAPYQHQVIERSPIVTTKMNSVMKTRYNRNLKNFFLEQKKKASKTQKYQNKQDRIISKQQVLQLD